MGALGWGILLAVLTVAGFVAVRSLGGSPDAVETEIAAPVAATEDDPEPPSERAEPSSDEPDEVTPEETEGVALSGYGEEEEGVARTFGVDVVEGHGLVVLSPSTDGSPVRVRLGGVEHVVGAEPVALALPEGPHEVVFVRGDDLSFRFVHVQSGRTLRVPPP
ncbi:MAG: hypothetical protein M3Y87_23115 [Myxococcota bacterium]|nr:hypothetical protein [Myxococcota bacterium]